MATHSVKVRRGPFSGRAADGTRVNIVPGTYKVNHDGDTLVFADADKRTGGNVVVDLRDYVETGTFPNDIEPNCQIAII